MDELTKFKDWWVNNRIFRPPIDFYSCVGDNVGIVLYRHLRFQIQLFIAHPNSSISSHIHPNVDSYEIFLAGDLYFEKNGQVLVNERDLVETPQGAYAALGLEVRVLPTDWHGTTVGPRGGSFLSVQEWLNGVKPSSVHLDWGGEPLSQAHGQELSHLQLKA